MYGKGWRYIAIGGLFEIVWVVAMKYSNGFTDIFWTAVSVIFIALSMLMLSKALDTGMPLGTAYAVWVGIGAAGVFAYGIMFLGDPSEILRIIFAGMIVVGIVGLQRTSEKRTSD